MNRLRDDIIDILSGQFLAAKEELTDETGPGDLPAWNSLGQLQLILKLESRFKIRFSADDVMAFNNVGELIDLVEGYVSAGKGQAP